jgi:uncharacterized protein YuzE
MAAVKQKVKANTIAGALALAREIGNFPASTLWLDYDSEADVLYISLKRPQKATDTVDLDEQGILLSYRGRELVGITVLEASKR